MTNLANCTSAQAAEFIRAADDFLAASAKKRQHNGAQHFIDEQDERFVDLPKPLPCPHCAQGIISVEVEIEDPGDDPFCEATCSQCGASGGGGHRTALAAAEAWNTRRLPSGRGDAEA